MVSLRSHLATKVEQRCQPVRGQCEVGHGERPRHAGRVRRRAKHTRGLILGRHPLSCLGHFAEGRRRDGSAARETRALPNHAACLRYLGRFFALTLAFIALSRAAAAETNVLDRWFAAQSELKSWSAKVTQTRTLKALKDPLKAEGRVWFAAPNRFRWELGDPAQTIAVREAAALVVVYPKLKRAERYALNGPGANQWRDALTLLEAGFPRSRSELEKQFQVVATLEREAEAELVLQPRASRARKLIAEVRLVFGKEKLELRATELRFADGSQLRNEFAEAQLNPALEDALFTASVPADFKVTEPLKRDGK